MQLALAMRCGNMDGCCGFIHGKNSTFGILAKKTQIGMNTVFPAVCQVQNYRELPGFFLGGDL
jgi:hypothetical protein